MKKYIINAYHESLIGILIGDLIFSAAPYSVTAVW